jgi:hypothetical protein
MKFAEFFFKIRDGTEDDGKLFDYEVIVRQRIVNAFRLFSIKDITIDHEQKKIYIWID